jgi:hypothetical protein
MHNANMIYGSARLSTGAQDLARQLAQLKAAGCEKIFREKIHRPYRPPDRDAPTGDPRGDHAHRGGAGDGDGHWPAPGRRAPGSRAQ